MPNLAGMAMPYVNKVYGAANRGLIALGKRGRAPIIDSMNLATRSPDMLSGMFGSSLAANNYYRRRGIGYVGGAVGASVAARGLRPKSSGGSGYPGSQNVPMY